MHQGQRRERTLSTGVEVIPWWVESSSQNVTKKVAFSTDSSCVVQMRYTEDAMSAMVVESREACKCLRKLGIVMKTVAAHCLKDLRHLQAVKS